METRNGKTDEMPMNRVILMSCGSYDPPTNMHLRMFERARDHLHTLRSHTVIGGVISLVKDCSANKDLTNSTARIELLNLALKSSDWIRFSNWEIQQNTPKSTRETLQHHQNILNSFINNDIDNNVNSQDVNWLPENIKRSLHKSPVQIKLLCGADLFENISNIWSEEDIYEIVGQYGLVVIGKEGGNPYKLIYDSDILSKHLHNIQVVTEWIPNEVNSTRIRRALRRGESVKYLVQDNVIKSIYERGIYDTKKFSTDEQPPQHQQQQRRREMDGGRTGGGRLVLMSCGSYNPPTHMHLRMFERARDHLHKLGTHTVVGGVISPVNDAYAKKELASGEHRCEMLRLALQDSEWIRLSTWEIRQPGWTRTRQSLQHHQALLDAAIAGEADANCNRLDDQSDLHWIPEGLRNNEGNDRTPVQIKLLCGGDLLESFATPGLWAEEDIAEIVGQYGLIVITREGSNPYKFIYDSDVLSKHLHNIQIVTEWIPNEVSSTRIRRALKRGESVKYLLQDPVIEYVYANGIYGANRASTIKSDLLSNVSPCDQQDEEEEEEEAEATTPSPSDVTMLEADPVLRKNRRNSSELAREKFFRSIIKDALDSPPPPPQPSSARARNELLAFDDSASLCAAADEEDELSVTYEESSEELNESSSVRNTTDAPDDSDSQATRLEAIDGKYLKSLVNSKKCARKEEEKQPEEEEEQQPKSLFEDELSYIKRLRLIVDEPSDAGKKLQGSLDSIELQEARPAVEPISKKSKSLESIKRGAPLSFRSTEIPLAAEAAPATEEYCSACCLNEPASSSDAFYTLRSNCSSPADSTECDICASCEEQAPPPDAAAAAAAAEEICEICGEPAAAEEPLGPARAALPKAKSSVEIRSRPGHDDERFEIENCGLRECKFGASLDACRRAEPEPLYVNVAAVARSQSIGPARRPSRKGSYCKRTQEKRRYSSADNLQNRLSFRAAGTADRLAKLNTSTDSLRSRLGRSRSLRRSADNVARYENSSADNLDALTEATDGDEAAAAATAAAKGLRIRDSDTIKMILTKHGIKIISQRETVL